MLKDIFAMPLSIILLWLVFFFIAIRKIGPYRIPIWLIMSVAALLVLCAQEISFEDAYKAVDINVLLYLFGVFIIGVALEESYFLESSMLSVLNKASSGNMLLALLILILSLSTILLMNDTVAIVGTPAILIICKKVKLPPLPLLLCLAFTITLSSVVSPIGNPQNLLIANKMTSPFISFFKSLFIPTVINSVLMFAYIRLCFFNTFKSHLSIDLPPIEVDKSMARLSLTSVFLMLTLILFKIILTVVHIQLVLPFSAIAIIAALPIILFSKDRLKILKLVDWHTLIFFFSMFIFMEAVWLSNYFQTLVKDLSLDVTKPLTITGMSLILSQLISNVPLVALYLPLIKHVSNEHYLLLAMASTMAGNLLVLGAASNVIIIQNAEKRGAHAFSFLEFAFYGIPLCLIQVLVYYWWLF